MNHEQVSSRTSSPFLELLGIHNEEIGGGKATISLEIVPKLTQNLGMVHGGVVASLLDTAIGTALYSNLPEDRDTVTVELKINYIRPAKGKKLLAKAEIVHQGKTLAVGRADAYDEERKLTATASATFYILGQQPSG